MKRIFHIDIETFQISGGVVQVIVCIENQMVIEMVLNCRDAKAAELEKSRPGGVRPMGANGPANRVELQVSPGAGSGVLVKMASRR